MEQVAIHRDKGRIPHKDVFVKGRVHKVTDKTALLGWLMAVFEG